MKYSVITMETVTHNMHGSGTFNRAFSHDKFYKALIVIMLFTAIKVCFPSLVILVDGEY